MLVTLTIASTYISPEGRVFRKGEVYDVSEATGQSLLSLADDNEVPRFKLAAKPSVQRTAEEEFDRGVVQIPDDMKKGSPGRPRRMTITPRTEASTPTDDEGEIDTGAGVTV